MVDEGQKVTNVRARDCTCPGTPHPDGDWVYLHPSLPFLGGMAARSVIAAVGGDPIIAEELLGKVYLRHGIAGWNLVDAKGRLRDVTPETAEAEFPWSAGGRLIVEACDELYQEEILAPLLERIEALSEPGPTGPIPEETFPTKRSTRKSRRRS